MGQTISKSLQEEANRWKKQTVARRSKPLQEEAKRRSKTKYHCNKKQIVAISSNKKKQICFTVTSEPSEIALSRRSNRAVLRTRKQQFSRTMQDAHHCHRCYTTAFCALRSSSPHSLVLRHYGTTALIPMSDEHDGDNESQGSLSSSDSHLCCCVCHCAVDYSYREAFFQENRGDDAKTEHYPLLPTSLYDEQNAMVLCDSCDRPYHQRCHFVPLISLPRGDWHCLICKTGGGNSVYPFPPKSDAGEILANEDETQKWEFTSRSTKASAWKREFARLKRAFSNQLQHIRLAEDTLRAHTSTKRAQQHISLKSQILCQTFVKLAGAKLRIRQWFVSLEKVLKSDENECNILDEFLSQNPGQVAKWFPYGRDMEKRIVPRLEQHEEVPTEVVVPIDKKKSIAKDVEDDDMISLDELKCCICFKGDSTDENDLFLCDGAGCFRAYHMLCVSPHITDVGEEHEDEDWFCPLCTCMASLLAEVQSEYTGDEWGGDGDSIHSWENAGDVFPEAPHEYQMALHWKEGKHSTELIQFLSELLGMPAAHHQIDYEGNYDEEDEEDDDFDDENKSQASSLDSLHDLSSVEVKIDTNELDALSVDSEEENGGRRTRSSRATSAESSSVDNSHKPNDGTLDKSNIVEGKRRRKQVDYRKLNDSMFGDISDTEAARMFDDRDDEFKVQKSPAKRKRRRKSSSSSSLLSTSSSEDSVSNESSSQPKRENQAKRRPRKEKQSSETSWNSVLNESSPGPKKAHRAKGRPRKEKQSSVASLDSLTNESSLEQEKTSRAKRRPRTTKLSSEAPSNSTSPSQVRTSRGKAALKKPAVAKMARKKLPKSASSSDDSKYAVTNEETRSVPQKESSTRAKTRSSKKENSSQESSNATSPESKSPNGRGRKKQALKPPAQNGRKIVNGIHFNGKGRT